MSRTAVPSCTRHPECIGNFLRITWACDQGGKQPWREVTGCSYIPEPKKTQEMIPGGGIPGQMGTLRPVWNSPSLRLLETQATTWASGAGRQWCRGCLPVLGWQLMYLFSPLPK